MTKSIFVRLMCSTQVSPTSQLLVCCWNGSEADDLASLYLIHGSPGTGKTTTSTAIVSMNAWLVKKVLVCAPSNATVDVIYLARHKKKHSFVRYGRQVSEEYRSVLLLHAPEVAMKEKLSKKQYAKNGKAWKKHRSE